MQPYLSEKGKQIYQVILKHIDRNNWSQDIDDFELSMLANAFDMYEKCALTIQTSGMTQTAKNNFEIARPEISIMEKVYGIILKHSAKFGLNPGDRKKIFKVIDQKKRKKAFDTSTPNYNKIFADWWSDQYPDKPVDYSQFESFKKYYVHHNEEPETLLDLI